MKWLGDIVDAINKIHVNVWGVVFVAVGAGLTIHSEAVIGGNLITGGFALVTGAQLQKNGTVTNPPGEGQPK